MSQHRTIYGLAKAAGLDEDAMRDLYERETGLRSLKAMSHGQRERVIGALKSVAPAYDPPEEKAHHRKILAMWWKLWKAGSVAREARDGKAAKRALNAFIAGKTFKAKWGDVPTHYRFLSLARANDVIEALKAIGRRDRVNSIK